MMPWLLFTSHFMNHIQASHIAKHGSQIANVYKILLHKICLKNQCFFLHHNARMLMETTFIISFTKLSPFTKETQSVSPHTHPPLKEYQRFCPWPFPLTHRKVPHFSSIQLFKVLHWLPWPPPDSRHCLVNHSHIIWYPFLSILLIFLHTTLLLSLSTGS